MQNGGICRQGVCMCPPGFTGRQTRRSWRFTNLVIRILKNVKDYNINTETVHITNNVHVCLVKIFSSNVKTVLLYVSESWTTTQRTLGRLQVVINKCLRRFTNTH